VHSIETPRLLLRLPVASDAQPLLDIHEHPDVIKYVLSGASPGGITGAWRSIATMLGHWQLRGYGQWTVLEKCSGDIVGRVGLWNPEGWPGIELGWITRRERWGEGIASEAARASLEWAWSNIDEDHIISIIQHDNVASIRVAEKIGETLEHTDNSTGSAVYTYGIRKPTGVRSPSSSFSRRCR
jgi:RimJ/RimL family protein N-acetyltransferase